MPWVAMCVSVGISEQLAISSGEDFGHLFKHFRVFGRYYPGQGDEANTRIISIGYFETLQARLLKGRYFTETDNASQGRVAIVNRTMASQMFPGEDPLGKRLIDDYDRDHPVEIVGVVDDIKEGPAPAGAMPWHDLDSEEELEFCAQHGYFAKLNDNKRKVTSEELRTFEKGLNDFQRGKSSADVDY